MFFPSVKVPGRNEVQDQLDKVYPGSKVRNYEVSDYVPGNPSYIRKTGKKSQVRIQKEV